MEIENFLKNLFDDDVESFLSDLEDELSSSSEREVLLYKADEVTKIYEFQKEVGEAFINDVLPPQPDDPKQLLFYNYYYGVQFAILYNKLNGEKPLSQLSDTEEEIEEKAYFVFLNDCFNDLVTSMEVIAKHIFQKTKDFAIDHLNGLENYNTHPISDLMKLLVFHKELHTRRAKLDPATSRMKTDTTQITWNAITSEQYDPNNEDHKLWKMLIFKPLHTDYDNQAVDMEENPYQLCDDIPEPFAIVVTSDWDKLLRIIHICIHFQEYLFTYINNSITTKEWDQLEDMTWVDSWEFLTKEYGELRHHKDNPKENIVVTTVNNFSREKKQIPLIVFRISILRDFLKVIIKF